LAAASVSVAKINSTQRASTDAVVKHVDVDVDVDVDSVVDADPPPPDKGGGAPSPIFGPCLLWQNGCMDQDTTWYGGRPLPIRYIVFDVDPATPRKQELIRR